MQRNEVFQRIGQMCAPLGLPTAERRMFDAQRVWQMIHARNDIGREMFAVVTNPAHRNTAKAHTVVATFTPNEFRALRFAFRTMIGQCHFQRCVHRFGTRVGEKHFVHAFRCDLRQFGRGFKYLRMPHLKHRRVVQFLRRFTNRLNDRRAAMTGIHTPQSRRTV